MALIGTLTDTFTSAFDTAKWDRTTTAVVTTSGQLHVPSDTGYHHASSVATYDLTGSSAMVEIVSKPATADVYFALRTVQGSISNQLSFQLASNGLMVIDHTLNNVVTYGSVITFNATNHRWLRIRHAGGTVFFETSPDASTWTQQWSVAPTLAITSLYAVLQSGIGSGTTTDAVFDNFNSAPAGGGGNPLIGTLTDTFGTAFDTAKWGRTTTAIATVSGELRIPSTTATPFINSVATYDLAGSSAMVEIVSRPAGGFVLFALRTSPAATANEVAIYIAENGLMYARHAVGGVETLSSNITWSPTTHRWLRIRHASGTVFFETSTNSVAFTPFFSMTLTLTATALFMVIGAGAATTAADLVLDNFNNAVAGPPSASATNWFRYFMGLGGSSIGGGGTGSLLFTGDYLTGNFSQWPIVQNQDYNGAGTGYTPVSYAAVVQADATYGQCARIEIRDGDIAVGSTYELSEVQGGTTTGGVEGDVRWYEFAVKFDANFPTNHASNGFWGVTNQWHHTNPTGAPPVGWYVDKVDGQWSLVINKQSAPGVYLSQASIYNTPLIPSGNNGWNDIRMEIKFSTSDATGYIRLWHNGNRVTFIGGSQTYNVRTLVPGDTAPGGTYYKEGYARDPLMTQSGILHQANFKCATTEAPLGTLMPPIVTPPPPSTDALNRPANPLLVAYGDSVVPTTTVKNAWSKPGALIVAGRANFGAQWLKDCAAGGATVLLYLHAALDNTFGRYADKLYNASEFGAAVPLWPANAAGPGPWVIDEWGRLPNCKVSNTMYWTKLNGVLNLMIDENPHMSGWFFDGLGSRHWPGAGGFNWDTWPTSEQEEYRNANIKIAQTARDIINARGGNFMMICNGQWQGWSAIEGNGGYPIRSQHGCSLVDGIMFENRPPTGPGTFAYEYSMNASCQWGLAVPRLAAMPVPRGYVISHNSTTAERDAWVAYGAVSHAYTGDFSALEMPWKTTFTDFNMPHR